MMWIRRFLLILSFCLVNIHSSQINLIWQSPKEGLWETDWILELLSDFEINEVIDGKYEVCMDKAILITGIYSGDYFARLQEKNCRFGVIHISDEVYSHPTFYYDQSSFVFRNYWHKQFAVRDNTHFFALGYKRGLPPGDFESQSKNSYQREYTWGFAGGIVDQPGRWKMISNMQKIPHFYFHEIFTWNDPHSLNTQDYRDLLLDTIFVPCPRGYWNLDSFRVYEALECGCIPIVEKTPLDYFTLLFGEHPFLSVESWDEAPALINALLRDPIRMEQIRLKCHQWWVDYKKETRGKFKTVIEDAFFAPPHTEFGS